LAIFVFALFIYVSCHPIYPLPFIRLSGIQGPVPLAIGIVCCARFVATADLFSSFSTVRFFFIRLDPFQSALLNWR